VTVTTPTTTKPLELSCPFATWFTADGYFVADPFQQWLSNSVDLIAAADKKHSSKSEKEELFLPEQELNGTTASTSSSQAGKTPKKTPRKR
jgi:hypothetical protein